MTSYGAASADRYLLFLLLIATLTGTPKMDAGMPSLTFWTPVRKSRPHSGVRWRGSFC